LGVFCLSPGVPREHTGTNPIQLSGHSLDATAMAKKIQLKLVDPIEIFAHSERFLEAAATLAAFVKNGNRNLVTPMFVNYALALELALKSLIAIERRQSGLALQPMYIHNLSVLFNSLNIINQKRVLRYAREFTSRDSNYANFQKHVGRRVAPREALARSSKAFEKLRYAYEISKEEYTYAAHPIDFAVRRVISDYHPDWPHGPWRYDPRTPPTSRSH
jgi:hypothetical protein